MNTQKPPSLVIGVSSVSGGGKTALAGRLAELLRNSVTFCFDDYDDTNIHPPDRQAWLREGADYNAWETPVLTKDLQSLKSGISTTSPIDGSRISPAEFIVFDAPLGRVHLDTGRFIDFMVFVDTPLDVAMARRLLRDIPEGPVPGVDGVIAALKAGLSSYLSGGRSIYLEFQKQVKRTSDLVLDGCLPVDELAAAVYMRIKQYKSSQPFT